MNIKIIAPIMHFELEMKNSINKAIAESFFISNDQTLVHDFFNIPELIYLFGTMEIDQISEKFTAYYSGPSEDLPQLAEHTHESKMAESINGFLDTVFSYFWFIKDNSIYVPRCCLLNLDGQVGVKNQRDILLSNSKGEYDDTSFTVEEAGKAINIYRAAMKLVGLEIQKKDVPKFDPTKITIAADLNYIAYDKSINRIERALRFLYYARSNSFLPQRISFYICILECLFTTGNEEVTHKVSERTAHYIGGDKKTKLANYKLIKDAYGIRSSYFHGGVLKGNDIREKLVTVSTGIDSILRILLLKVITEDSSVFLSSDLSEWFTELIFSNSKE